MDVKPCKKFKCEWCSRNFSTKANLTTHQKTAKYCLQTRTENVKENLSVCDICGKTYSQFSTLQKHYKKCSAIRDENFHRINSALASAKDEIDKEWKEKTDNLLNIINISEKTNRKDKKLIENQTKKLEDQAILIAKLKSKNLTCRNHIKNQKEEIINLRNELNREQGILIGYKASKPPTIVTNNNIITNKLKMVPTSKIKPFTPELIESCSETYTYEQFVDGKDGLISHLLQTTVFEDEDGRVHKNYVCTNRSRNTFHILLSADDWKLDPCAYQIHNYLDSLRPFAEAHYKQFKIFSDNIKYGDPRYDVQYYKDLEIKLLDFTKAFREGPCDANREKLLKSVRSGIKNRLSV